MAFPAPALGAPSLSADQLSFQGLTLGAGTPFGLRKLEGLEKPDVRSGNIERPRTRGAFVGLNLLKTRTITATLDIGPPFGSYGGLAGALAALRNACTTEGTQEYALWLRLPGLPQVASMARVIRMTAPWDITADIAGLLQSAVVQWEATDPYLYASPTQNPSVGLPAPSGGMSFPLTFPLSFGGGSAPNQVTVTNGGNVPCWPTLVVTGPCVNPTIANQSISGAPALSFSMQLQSGDQLMIDCDLQSIVFFAAGQARGVPYNQILRPGSVFFALPPGSSVLAFNSQDVSPATGTLQVWYASAYDGLI